MGFATTWTADEEVRWLERLAERDPEGARKQIALILEGWRSYPQQFDVQRLLLGVSKLLATLEENNG